jgi:hypothetical protein
MGRNLLGRLEDEDDANQGRLLGIDLTSASGWTGWLGPCRSETGEEVGAGLGSRRSAGGDVTSGAGSGVVGRTPAANGGTCLASSFKGVFAELRRDNDASHERDCGAGAGTGASGASEGLTRSVPDAGRTVVSLVGEDE